MARRLLSAASLLFAAAILAPARAPAAAFRITTRQGAFAVAARGAFASRAAQGLPPMPSLQVGEAADALPAVDADEVIAPDGLALVHFHAPIDAGAQAALATLGVVVHGHLGDDTLLVEADGPAARDRIDAVGEVAAVAAAPAWLRLEDSLLAPAGAGIGLAPIGAGERITLLVEATSPAALPSLLTATVAAGGEVDDDGQGGRFARVTVGARGLVTLARAPELLHAGRWQVPHTTNSLENSVVQAGPGPRGRTPAWDHGLRGEGQVLAIGDSAFNLGSCYLSGDGKAVSLTYYNIARPTSTIDAMLHGTHVAGTTAGDQGHDGIGGGEDGQAPAMRLVLQALTPGNASSILPPSSFGTLAAAAAAGGAHAHTNSWGDSTNTYTVFSRSIDQAAVDRPDLLLLFANGNAGPGAGTVSSEANAKNILAVGAYPATTPEEVASFQSRGPTYDGRWRPHVTGPGVNVTSADYAQACGLRTLSGTSMATPAIASASMLVRQYLTDGFYAAGAADADAAITPSAALVKAMVIAAAENMTGASAGGSAPNGTQGYGRVNLSRALWFADAGPPALWLKDVDGDNDALATGDRRAFALPLRAGADVRITLVWTDPPALAQAATTLVNDLDLVVTAPDGTVWVGNALANGVSVADGAFDRLHSEELVVISSAQAGYHLVEVRAHRVALGAQTFALAARGALADRPGAASWEASPLGPGAPQDVEALRLLQPTQAVTVNSVQSAATVSGSGDSGRGPDMSDMAASCRAGDGGPASAALALALAARRRARGRQRPQK